MPQNPANRKVANLSEMRLPARSLDTSSIDVADQIEVWQGYNAPLVEFRPIDDGRPGLDAAVRIWQTRSLLLIDLKCQRPDSQRYLVNFKPSKEEYLILRYGRAGAMMGRIGDDPMDFHPGDVHLFDIRHPFQALSSGVDQISLYLTYNEIGYDPSRDPPHMVFRAGSPTNALIRSTLEVIHGQLPDTTAADAAVMTTGLCGMLKGIIASGRVDEGSRASFEKLRTEAIRRFILENLTDKDLNAENLSRQFGASRATIYRAFEDCGGIARFISDHRLDRAKWDLINGGARRGLVRTVAERYGFNDTGNFNRAFRRRFDMTPTELVGDYAAEEPVPADLAEPQVHAATDTLRLSSLLKS